MATQNKAQDPLAAAMSAIEDALNLPHDDGLVDTSRADAPRAPAGATPAPAPAKPSPLPNAGFEPKPPAPTPPAAALPPTPTLKPSAPPTPPETAEAKPILAPGGAPANDDRPSVGQILQAMQTRPPSRAPFVVALVASLAWLALCVVYDVEHYGAEGAGALTGRDFWLRPEIGLAALTAIGPALFLFALAFLARRAQELRASARSMTQVAMRLAEPETLATDQVVTLSQAIRREVASMGDGIERALARASELENLVRAEVSTLERSYSENERRIRSLIAEMADQREAIVANGGRVRAAIAGAHQGVAADLDAISDRMSERVSEAGRRVVSSLGSTSEEISATLDRTGHEAVGRIADQSWQMRDTLAALGAEVSARLGQASDDSANALIARVAQIDDRF